MFNSYKIAKLSEEVVKLKEKIEGLEGSIEGLVDKRNVMNDELNRHTEFLKKLCNYLGINYDYVKKIVQNPWNGNDEIKSELVLSKAKKVKKTK